MKLRPTQQKAFEAVEQAFKQNKSRVLVQAPCGFGKTVLAAHLMKWAVQTYNVKCLFLAHLTELILQTKEKLQNVDKTLEVGLYCDSADKAKILSGVTIGSRQSLSSGLDSINYKFSLLIIDEAHLFSEQHRKIIAHFTSLNPRLRILGLTGTPFRTGEGYIFGKDKFFPELNFACGMREMIDQGYLCDYKYLVVDKSAACEAAESTKKTAGDYNQKELSSLMQEERHMESIEKAIQDYAADRKRIMIFCVNIEHAETLAKYLKCPTVHSKQQNNREIIDQFKAGKYRIITNVNVLSIGFDCPEVDCVVMARPTLSPALMVQQAGRGLRLANGKTNCLILDCVNNYKKHGLIDNPEITKDIKTQKKKELVRRARICPECFELVNKGFICEKCGTVLKQLKDIIEINERQKMIEIQKNRIYEVLAYQYIPEIKAQTGWFRGVGLLVHLSNGDKFTMKAWSNKTKLELQELTKQLQYNRKCKIIYKRKKKFISLLTSCK